MNGFTSHQLLAGGLDTSLASVDGLTSQGTPTAIAVDLKGNLWVATASNVIGEYPYGQLEQRSTSGPTGATISTVQTPAAMAFDPAGNLWVAFPTSGQVAEYQAAQLTGSGAPLPFQVIDLPNLTSGQAGLAFDNLGNLWVTASASGSLIEVTSARLAGTGTAADTVTVHIPQAVAPVFDPSGRLWVVTGQNTILAFSAEQTATFSQTTVPSLTVTVNTTGAPQAAAFDNLQDLWIAEGTANTVVELAFTQLTTAGTQTPFVSLTLARVANTVSLAFNPKGQFTPLAGQHTPAAPASIAIHK
jgi:sugar lactone lactonase YvrE